MTANCKVPLLLALVTGVGACSPAPDKEVLAREATASVVAGSMAEQVTISQLEAGAAKTSWRAETGGKAYTCDADELMRLPDCRPVE